jgi:transitional endoplasmic reticulum ATPase
MRLPNIDNPVHIQMGRDGAHITGTFKRHEKETIVKIRMQADKLLRSESIYKGKAIKYNVDDDGDLVLTEQPEFIDLSLVSESDMIHTHHTAKAIENNVFAPLRHTDNCRRLHIPLKRGVLLFGKYGTGKSLTARVTAKVAEDNGWTFIMLNKSQGLKSAIEFAKMYQPCVIFAEDIDRCADREEESVNDLVNTLDGLINKNDEIITVLTTNFIEKIDKALLRPGRFDALIHIEPPDAETSIKIVYAYAQSLIEPNTDLSTLGQALAGKIPALIREVVERAKLSMLTEGRKSLTYDDLDIANTLLNKHQELLEAEPKELSPAETFYQSWKAMVSESMYGVESMSEFADNMIGNMNEVQQVMRARFINMDKRLDATQTAAMGAGSAASDAKKLVTKLLKGMGIPVEA